MTTPIVSASQEMIIPGHMPNTRPFAVEIKMDGKKPTALTKNIEDHTHNHSHRTKALNIFCYFLHRTTRGQVPHGWIECRIYYIYDN